MKIYFKSLAMLIAATCAGTAAGQSAAIERLNNAPDEASLIALHQELNVPRGEIDGDGQTFFGDFTYLMETYGIRDVGYSGGDLNIDGIVDLGDYAISLANFANEEYMAEPSFNPPAANLGLWLSDENELIVSSSNPMEIGGIEILSTGATLTAFADLEGSPEPFISRTARRRCDRGENQTSCFIADEQPSDRFGFYTLRLFIDPLDGDMYTGYRADSTNVRVRWFEKGSYDIHELDFGVGDAVTGRIAALDFPEPTPTPNLPPASPRNPGGPIELIDPRFSEATNLEDLVALHESANVPRGDSDTNGRVDFGDFLQLVSNYGIDVETDRYRHGDFNLDGKVDLGDFAILSTNFGTHEFVPDPPPVDRVALTPSQNDEQKVVISTDEPVQIVGLEIRSANSGLRRISDAAPFAFILGEFTRESVTFGNLGASVSIDGELVTTARTAPDAELALSWIQRGSYEVFSTPESSAAGAVGPTLEGNTPVVPGETPLPPPLVGDINGDGEVGFHDFLVLSDNYGQDVAVGELGDLDADGAVDFPDFLLLADNYGTVTAASVPEPLSSVMFAAMGSLLCFRKRRCV